MIKSLNYSKLQKQSLIKILDLKKFEPEKNLKGQNFQMELYKDNLFNGERFAFVLIISVMLSIYTKKGQELF